MKTVFNGHIVESVDDLIEVSQRDDLHLRPICGEPKRYTYLDMGKLDYSREAAAKWFAEQLGLDTIDKLDDIREELL